MATRTTVPLGCQRAGAAEAQPRGSQVSGSGKPDLSQVEAERREQERLSEVKKKELSGWSGDSFQIGDPPKWLLFGVLLRLPKKGSLIWRQTLVMHFMFLVSNC